MPASKVRIVGLRELNTAFKQIDSRYGKEQRAAMKGVADMVLRKIQAKVPGGAGGALKVTATQRGAGIKFPAGEDRGRWDFYPWLDFGGSTGRHHMIGKPWTGSVKRDAVKGGRYIYPTLAQEHDAIGEAAVDALLALARKVDFETSR